MACEVFKIVYKLSPEYIQDMISIKTSTYYFRGERKADIPRVNTTRYGLRSFRSEAPRIWNSLPNNLRVAVIPAVPRAAQEMGKSWMWMPSVLCLVLFFAFCFRFALLCCYLLFAFYDKCYLSQCMGFLTVGYVRPAKP